MRKSCLLISFGLVALAAAPLDLQGQIFTRGRFALEPRVGIAFPSGDFGNVDSSCPAGATGCDYPLQTGAEAGWRWEARVHYQLTEDLSLVSSFGRAKFGCGGPFCGFVAEPESKALSLGIRSRLFSLGSMAVWGEGGGSWEKFSIIRTLDPSGDPESTRVWYPWASGLYGGGGVELALTGKGNFFFTPGFQFRYVTSNPPGNHSDLSSVTATYLVAEIGFKVLFGMS